MVSVSTYFIYKLPNLFPVILCYDFKTPIICHVWVRHWLEITDLLMEGNRIIQMKLPLHNNQKRWINTDNCYLSNFMNEVMKMNMAVCASLMFNWPQSICYLYSPWQNDWGWHIIPTSNEYKKDSDNNRYNSINRSIKISIIIHKTCSKVCICIWLWHLDERFVPIIDFTWFIHVHIYINNIINKCYLLYIFNTTLLPTLLTRLSLPNSNYVN